MKHEYPGGVLPHERPMIERFEEEILPFIESEGHKIGEFAMSGDPNATEIINRYRLFVEGLPDMRSENYKLLVRALKFWQKHGPTNRSMH